MKAEWKAQSDINRTEWQTLIQACPYGNFFVEPNYMDLIAPGWSGIEVRDKGELLAIMPLNLKKKGPFTYAVQPPLSQYWGIFVTPNFPTGIYKGYSWKRKVVQAAISAIPKKIKYFLYNFAPEFDYPLPFHWAGYKLQTRYTYQIDLQKDDKTLLGEFAKNTRGDYRKAKDLQPYVRASRDTSALRHLFEEYSRAGKPLIKDAETDHFFSIIGHLLDQGASLLEVAPPDGPVMAAGVFVQYGAKTTYLVSALDPAAKGSGAMTILLWQAMQNARASSTIFDFEGSMIESIEGFFRGFGARPVPYLNIQKNQLPLLLRWINDLR